MFLCWLFSFFNFWFSWFSFFINFFFKGYHFFFGVLKTHVSVVKNQYFLSYQACMVLWTHEVGITWCHTLKINNITSLICSSYSFDFYAPSNFHFLPSAIYKRVDLDIHLFTHLLHFFMKLWMRLNCFLFIDCTVFCKSRQLWVVQDTRNYALSNYSVTSVVYYSCCQEMETFNFQKLQTFQSCHIMICLGPTWIVFWRC